MRYLLYDYIQLEQTVCIRHFSLDLPYEEGFTSSKLWLNRYRSVQYGY